MELVVSISLSIACLFVLLWVVNFLICYFGHFTNINCTIGFISASGIIISLIVYIILYSILKC